MFTLIRTDRVEASLLLDNLQPARQHGPTRSPLSAQSALKGRFNILASLLIATIPVKIENNVILCNVITLAHTADSARVTEFNLSFNVPLLLLQHILTVQVTICINV